MEIGERIRELRKEKDLSGAALARKTGVTRNTISRIELGRVSPSTDTLEKLARGLNVEPGALLAPLAGAR